MIRLAVRNGADVTQHGGFCGYVFHAAVVGCGNKHTANTLLEAGADVNAQKHPWGNSVARRWFAMTEYRW